MNLTYTKTFVVKFSVEWKGMDECSYREFGHEEFKEGIGTLEEAIEVLCIANEVKPDFDWEIICNVEEIIKKK